MFKVININIRHFIRGKHTSNVQWKRVNQFWCINRKRSRSCHSLDEGNTELYAITSRSKRSVRLLNAKIIKKIGWGLSFKYLV